MNEIDFPRSLSLPSPHTQVTQAKHNQIITQEPTTSHKRFKNLNSVNKMPSSTKKTSLYTLYKLIILSIFVYCLHHILCICINNNTSKIFVQTQPHPSQLQVQEPDSTSLPSYELHIDSENPSGGSERVHPTLGEPNNTINLSNLHKNARMLSSLTTNAGKVLGSLSEVSIFASVVSEDGNTLFAISRDVYYQDQVTFYSINISNPEQPTVLSSTLISYEASTLR